MASARLAGVSPCSSSAARSLSFGMESVFAGRRGTRSHYRDVLNTSSHVVVPSRVPCASCYLSAGIGGSASIGRAVALDGSRLSLWHQESIHVIHVSISGSGLAWTRSTQMSRSLHGDSGCVAGGVRDGVPARGVRVGGGGGDELRDQAAGSGPGDRVAVVGGG